MLKKYKSKLLTLLTFGGIFVFIFYFVYCFPKTGDDIYYSLSGNGRLLGNFLGYIIRFRYAAIIERTLVWFGIIVMLIALTNAKNIVLIMISASAIIYPGNSIFSEIYPWNAGFQNYAVPVLLVLFCLNLIKVYNKSDKKIIKILSVIFIIISGFASEFFSEKHKCFYCCSFNLHCYLSVGH